MMDDHERLMRAMDHEFIGEIKTLGPILVAEIKRLSADNERLHAKITVCCEACRRPYGDPGWIDVTMPDDQWAMISGRSDGGGILCGACMIERAARLPNRIAVRMRIEFAGDFPAAQRSPLGPDDPMALPSA